jgi:hypothetical protein
LGPWCFPSLSYGDKDWGGGFPSSAVKVLPWFFCVSTPASMESKAENWLANASMGNDGGGSIWPR